MLTLFKPWRKSVDELKHHDGTFKSAMMTYMFDSNFPKRILAAILRVKRNDKAVEVDESPLFHQPFGTPTSDRENEKFNSAMDAVVSPPSQENEEEFEDMDQTMFNNLEDRAPADYDWSKNYVSGQAEKLTQLAKTFYVKKKSQF